MSNEAKSNTSEVFDLKRAALRNQLMAAHLLDQTALLKFSGTFSGSGDSGNYDGGDYYNNKVDEFFSEAIEKFVDFDWYNDDGGGGDITWDVAEDKITISGYYNEIVSTDCMIAEEF